MVNPDENSRCKLINGTWSIVLIETAHHSSVLFLFLCVCVFFSPGLVLNITGAKTGQQHLTRKHAVQFGLNSYIFTYILKFSKTL